MLKTYHIVRFLSLLLGIEARGPGDVSIIMLDIPPCMIKE